MDKKILFFFIALAAYAEAASISGSASLDPNQFAVGGQVTFPRIPGLNAPLFGGIPGIFGGYGNNGGFGTNNPFGSFANGQNFPGIPQNNPFQPFLSFMQNLPFVPQGNGNNPFEQFLPFLQNIPGLNSFIPQGNNNGNNGNSQRFPGFPSFPNLEEIISNISESNGSRGNFSLPSLGFDNEPYIPGVSEALREAREHLLVGLNATSDLSTGLRDAVQLALDSNRPVEGVRTVLDTIARVYGNVASRCPFLLIGSRVFEEGVRLSFEVVRSIGNIALGAENNPLNAAGTSTTTAASTTDASASSSTTTSGSTSNSPFDGNTRIAEMTTAASA